MEELHIIYTDYTGKHYEYRSCLVRSMNSTDKSIKSLGVVYVATTSLIIMVLVFRFAHNQRIFVLQFEMPGIDVDTERGYLITNCIHCVCISFGAFGNYAADLCFLVFVSHAPLFKVILKCKFQDLNKVIAEMDNNETARDRCQILLKDILQWHQRYMR